MSFSSLSFSKKLIVTFTMIVLMVAATGGLVLWNLDAINAATARTDDVSKILLTADEASNTMLDASGVVRGFLLTQDAAFRTTYEADREHFRKTIELLRSLLASSSGAATANPVSEAGEGYFKEAGDPEIRLGADPATRDQALAIIKAGANKTWMNALKASVADLTKSQTAVSEERGQARANALNLAQWFAIGGIAAAILVSIGMGWLLSRSVGRPMMLITDAMRKLADGDNTIEIPAIGRADEVGQMAAATQSFKTAALETIRMSTEAETIRRSAGDERERTASARATAAMEQTAVVEAIAAGLGDLTNGRLTFRIVEAFAPEYEKLRIDFNGAMEKLQDTMKVVSATTSAIRSGTDEISSASDDLSRRTEQQAASLEETAAALDEITTTVRKTAEGSKHARDVVGQAKQAAEHSGQVVRQAVDAMSGIEKSANQIGNIIGVIDEIAFQTNLLALNAGVEAARAGDAGRGFAVVASEVRALAQRSADAAKEIKTLISASSHQVEQGVDFVGQTGRALEQIVVQVNAINGIVSEIAAATQEQRTGLDQVNTAVNQMDQVTQQNAAMVEQSTAASHALARETEELARLIGQFDVGERSGGATPIRGAARPVKAAPASKRVAAIKTVGRGGAVRKAAPEGGEWQEF